MVVGVVQCKCLYGGFGVHPSRQNRVLGRLGSYGEVPLGPLYDSSPETQTPKIGHGP